MAISQKMVYIAEDGREFDTQKQALEYDAMQYLTETLISVRCNREAAQELAIRLINIAEKVREVLEVFDNSENNY